MDLYDSLFLRNNKYIFIFVLYMIFFFFQLRNLVQKLNLIVF